jgi:hypothetical protein
MTISEGSLAAPLLSERARWLRLHWTLVAVLAAVCIAQTIYDVRSPAPRCSDWICLQGFDGLVTGYAWAYFVLAGGATTAMAYAKRWTLRRRALGYAVVFLGALPLAIPGAFVIGGIIGQPIKRAQIAGSNARLRRLLTLRRWSYRSDGAGHLVGTAEITALRAGTFHLSVTTPPALTRWRCEDSKTEGIDLGAGTQGVFHWALTCSEQSSCFACSESNTGPVPGAFRFSFDSPAQAVEELVRDERTVTFVRDVPVPESDGHVLYLPLPPPEGPP